jgi:hypothetical protein
MCSINNLHNNWLTAPGGRLVSLFGEDKIFWNTIYIDQNAHDEQALFASDNKNRAIDSQYHLVSLLSSLSFRNESNLIMPVITSSHGEDEDWVAFETNCAFKAERRKARVESNRQPTGPSSRSSPSNTSSASWMNKPINNDESWMPVAPPVVEARDAPERKRRDTSVERPSLSRNRDPPSVPSRYKSSIRRTPPRSPMSNKPMPVVSSVHDHISAETGTNPASSSSDSSSTESGDKAPCAQSRGLSDDRFIPKAPRVRGRSSSRTREPPDSNVRSSSRAREPSSIPPPSSRGRSSSRTRQPLLPSQSPTAQSTSSDRRTSLSPHSVANSPRRGFGSRPPVTSATRGRSLANSSPVARDRSTSKTRASRRPSSNNAGPGLPPRPPGANGSGNTLDANIGRNITFGVTNDISDVAATTADCRSGLMGRLFGDQTDGRQSPSHRATSLSLPDRILPRTLLSATVYHNTASNLWITTINTNQKGVATNPKTASKYLKAFSFPTERQARESAIANAPPKMIAFSKAPNCFICLKNFAMFKRAGHCRNCGVCVCNNCTTPWPSTSIPETYNLKKESKVKICNSCNKLSMDFKQALLHGKYDNVIELYNTGNVNLRTPFPVRSKEESM